MKIVLFLLVMVVLVYFVLKKAIDGETFKRISSLLMILVVLLVVGAGLIILTLM